MQRLHPEEQHSSLGISKALQEEIRALEEENNSSGPTVLKKNLTDDMFKVPSEQANIFIWMRFYVSLYYNKLAVNMFGFITGWEWYNRIDQHIILGALPTPSQIKKLHQQEKVETVVNLCSEFPGYEKLYKDLNIQQIRLETPDFTVPSTDLIHRGIRQIIERIQETNTTIYLHCKAGRGRSAAIALSYLVRVYSLNLTEAQKILINKRSQADKDLCQKDNIRAFYKDLLTDLENGKHSRVPFDDKSFCQC